MLQTNPLKVVITNRLKSVVVVTALGAKVSLVAPKISE